MLSVNRIKPHILGDVVSAKDKQQSGDGDGDVGEDEDARRLELGNFPNGKDQQTTGCRIHLPIFIYRQEDRISIFYLTETLDSFVAMAQSVATVRGPRYILEGKEYISGISRMVSTSFEISIFPQRSFSIALTSDSGSLSSRSRLTSLVKDKRKALNDKTKFRCR